MAQIEVQEVQEVQKVQMRPIRLIRGKGKKKVLQAALPQEHI